MNFLEHCVATPLAHAIGWTLIHSLWEGAGISVALALVLSLTRSARARYAAACLAMLATVGAVAITFIRLSPWGMPSANSAPMIIPEWNVHAPLPAAAPASPSLAAAVPWLAPFWILGVWIFVLAQVAGWISVLRLRTRGVCSAPDRWQNELLRLRARLRMTRPVRLLESCLADVPIVVGHIRPAILMPIGLLAGLPVGQIEAILLHELAHIRRHDYLVNVLQRSIESLFFYNPAVWWISRVIRTERENCCDDIVVATMGNAREYAIALTAIEEHRWSGRQAALAATGGNLMKRVHRLLYPKSPSAVWAPLLATLVLTTTAVAAFAAWPSAPFRAGFARHAQASATQPSKYERWLNEDVVYIITPRERVAFNKLATDTERDKFIEQFWERRNPHPGSAVNAYKQHYYHELAYANQHFGTKGQPGWKTDRGHMLILYGPPDEIDAHTAAKPYPYEEWMYKHIKGVGNNVTLTFIDRSGEGNYQLAPGPVASAPGTSEISEPAERSQRKGAAQAELPKVGKPLTCVFASVAYPEGTVIQEGDGPEQLCARALNERGPNSSGVSTFHPEWVRTNTATRVRSATVVHISVPPPYFCAPKASDKKGLCVCEDGNYSSPNAIANSANGPFQLKCGFDGNWIETKTPNVVRNNDSSQAPTPAGETTNEFVLGELRIEGDVHDRDAMRNGILAAWKGREYADEQKLSEAVTHLGVLEDLQDRGYFAASVSGTQTQLLGTADGAQDVLLTVRVHEGDQYHFRGLVVRGLDPNVGEIPPPDVVNDQFRIKRGDLFDTNQVRLGLSRLTQWYRARGRTDVAVTPSFKINDATHLIEVIVEARQIRPTADAQPAKDSSQLQVPASGTEGYSYPKCLYCPQPKYTSDAFAHKVQGSLTLTAVITAQGRAEDVKAVKTLPYGLTDNAIEAVKKWRFKPATGPDGKPAAVRQKIEVGFHTYS
jgi:TonB family protein